MKYKHIRKQNQRIQQITESTLVVGTDIAKKTHVARAVDFRGIELGKDCVFGNDHHGLTKLVTWMKELQRQHHKTEVVLGIEPTGHYWFPLAEFLQREGVRVVVESSGEGHGELRSSSAPGTKLVRSLLSRVWPSV